MIAQAMLANKVRSNVQTTKLVRKDSNLKQEVNTKSFGLLLTITPVVTTSL